MNKSKIQTNEAAPAIDRSFLSIIEAHKNGKAITEISRALKTLTSAVQLTGKGGTVNLAMKIMPASRGDCGTLVFLPKVKATIPEAETPGSIFYADDDFNLVRDDPNQTRLDLKTAEEAPSKPLKELSKIPAAQS